MASGAEQKASVPADLGVIRTALAAERTLMAWVRTALGMISFGFSIYRFMHALDRTEENGPRHLGIVMAALGTASLAAGTIQYARTLNALDGQRPGFTFYVACVGVAVGLLVLAGIVLRIGPLS